MDEIRAFAESFDPTLTTDQIDIAVGDWLDDLHARHAGYDRAGIPIPIDTEAISNMVQETNRAKAFIWRLVFLWHARTGRTAAPEPCLRE